MNAKTKLAAIALGLMAALANVIHAGLVVFIVSIVFSRCIVAQSGISGAMNHRGDRSNVVFLPLPVDISNYDAQHPDATIKNRLYHYTFDRLRSEELATAAEGPVDLVIVFTDHQGRPILPDLDAARSRFKQSEGRLRPAANELTFTFDSPYYPWSPAELTDLQAQLGSYYPTAKAFYGSPAFNITVNVLKNPTLSLPGVYFASVNAMVVRK